MANLLSFPFRLTTGGYAATVEDNTDDAFIEQLAAIILTQPGERPLVPNFGIADPTFDRITAADVSIQVQMFGPPVTITDVQTKFLSDTAADVIVSFA